MGHNNQKSIWFLILQLRFSGSERFLNRKTAAHSPQLTEGVVGDRQEMLSHPVPTFTQRSPGTTSCCFSHGRPYPENNSHGFWPCCCVACFPVPCFKDFQLLSVLLNVNTAVIPYVPCFLLSTVFQTEFAPISSLHQHLGLGLPWTLRIDKTTCTPRLNYQLMIM